MRVVITMRVVIDVRVVIILLPVRLYGVSAGAYSYSMQWGSVYIYDMYDIYYCAILY